MSVAIMTDTNSGMMIAPGRELGIHVLPMPFVIDGKFYLDDVDMTHEQFYEMMENGADVSTSQPSPGEVIDFWEQLLKEYDELVYIPMSSALSTSCETASNLAEDYNGRVHVVNNRRISCTQYQSVLDAKKMADNGFSGAQIKEILEREGLNATIYITVDTLKYLKKGGRVTAAAAAIGTVLNLKPVLTIPGTKLDSLAKARGMKKAKQIMLDEMHKEMDARYQEGLAKGRVVMGVAYTKVSGETLETWINEVKASFPGLEVVPNELALSIACHIGPGALAMTATVIPDEIEV